MSTYSDSLSLTSSSRRSLGSSLPLTTEERADYIFENLLRRAETKGSLMKWFRSWDWDQRGYLDHSKLLRGLQQLHYNIDEEVARVLLQKFDENGDNHIDFHEFATVMRPSNNEKRKEFFDTPDYGNGEVAPSDIRPVASGHFRGLTANEIGEKIFSQLKLKAAQTRSLFSWFRGWDEDKNGRLRREEIRMGLGSMNYDVSPETMDYLMTKFDVDGNGEINFNEFASVLQPRTGKDKYEKAPSPVYSDLKPGKSMVDRVLARLWKRLPDNKDALADLLETYDDVLTGLISREDFKDALKRLRVIKDFEVDIIIKSEEYDAGGLLNYKAFLQDASRVGCFAETVDAGRSPRLHAPFKSSELQHALHDQSEARLRESQLNLSPRSTVATRYENKPMHSSQAMASLLSPRDAPTLFADESERFAANSKYLPGPDDRRARRKAREDARHVRAMENERQVRERAAADDERAQMRESARLATYRRQQLWYNDRTHPNVKMTKSWHG